MKALSRRERPARFDADMRTRVDGRRRRVIDDDDSSIPISATELQRLRSQLDGLESLVSKVVYRNANGNGGGSARGDEEGSIVELEGAVVCAAHVMSLTTTRSAENDVAAALTRMMLTRTLVSGVASDPPIVEKVCHSSGRL